MRRQPRQLSPGFLQAARRQGAAPGGSVSEAILRNARKTGQLNLSNRALEVLPESVWHLNADPPPDHSVSFDTKGEERWWEGTDLIKLILAANHLRELSEDIRLLPALTVLDVHDNRLASLPHAIGELQNLTRLMLSHNALCNLSPEVCSLERLQVLKVDHNQLGDLPRELGSLSSLEELDLSHNSLSTLPPSLGEITTLRRLSATHNQITTLPESIGRMKGLRELCLNNNKLTTLPPLVGLGSLLVLDLRHNSLSELPSFRPTGTELKELRMGSNRLQEVEVGRLQPLTSLILLGLRDNMISSLPEGIADLKTLERLDLTNNNLPGLPYVMGEMPALKSVLLDGNPLKGLRRDIVQRGTSEILKYLRSRMQTEPIPEHPPHHTTKFTPTKQPPPHHTTSRDRPPESVGSCVSLDLSSDSRVVDISKKTLTSLPAELFQHPQITDLNAGYNKLTAVPPEIGQLRALTVLDLRNNHLKGLPSELGRCSELRDIVLSFNRLPELPPALYSLHKLENILADDNQIASIDVDGLLQLPLLACLDLQNNSIGHVPPQLGNVTTLRHLQLGGNPFRTPRAAVLAKGTPTLLQYLRDRIPT